MALIGFGQTTQNPRPHLPMLDDSILEIDPFSAPDHEMAHNITSIRRQSTTDEWATYQSYKDGCFSIVVSAEVGMGLTYHITYGPSVGWTIDAHDTWDSALAAHGLATSPDTTAGDLWFNGYYSTDGDVAYRAFKQRETVTESPTLLRADDFPHVPGISEWLTLDHAPASEGIFGVLLPELHPDNLVSYAAIEAMSGTPVSTLRVWVSRAEGHSIPTRQFSSRQGHPHWSRPVIEAWIAERSA
ncbi:MAG: hypothetical protein AAF567_11760 [Actinomycetota bacterium]